MGTDLTIAPVLNGEKFNGCYRPLETKDQPRYIGTAEITRATQAAIGYLSNHISPFGKFDYILDLRTGEVSSGYNLLRHAGTAMALYQMVGLAFDDGAIGSGSHDAI
jgi:hypothetical protein